MALSDAYDLETFIAEGMDNNFNTDETMFYTKIGNQQVVISNIYDKYIDFIKSYTKRIKLSPVELQEYKYNPKKLSYKLYGTEELYYLILKLNNISHEIEFNKKYIYLLEPRYKNILTQIKLIEEECVEQNHIDYM